ncbi:MAG: SpoIIE family protein phosphatase [Rubinisphaera brasiliensis]|uniref:Protein serine/threonine phosphatase with GAF(S) sensor(S) n=1 Tax=Rubinisphaera brasiliensis (strain ATCC 49424 / DSM 5305 / JCM 21570 / IAM 15109 / NBRC 103401 / IFAM 1448) TaxID=756272 RepID=F0ST13_RUBBR|nr:SpoIIE family protein phosphatase [Rubinisphaera brasiliensis]ADY58168.1 protein serine/threonine phosphatase with GAF(s) sensor(s) [Rubinisphaera brasiliensis DSM 5305]MBB03291.1 hypothetical protein [Planctomyces sp.]
MAFLRVIQGGRPGELHEVTAERLVLGRHPSCEVVLDNAVISRQHARLIRQEGKYVIEDLGSRNGTFVNGKEVSGLQEVVDADRIRICDYILEYLEQLPMIDETIQRDLSEQDNPQPSRRTPQAKSLQPKSPRTVEGYLNPELESSSSIITTIKSGPSSYRLDVRPELKLRAVLDLSRQLARTVDLKTLLSRTLDCLFQLFPQCEDGVIVTVAPETRQPTLRVGRNSEGDSVNEVPLSRAIVDRAMQDNEAILSEDVSDDSRFRDSLSASALEIRSMMCAPMLGFEDQAVGAIQLSTRNMKRIFNQEDLDLLVSVAAQVGLAVENTNLYAAKVSKRDMERDLEVATQIQLGFLPRREPNLLGFEFHHYYQAAQQVGGDYFDYVRLPDGRLAVAVGDVSGKGVPAALLMARLCSSVRFHLASQRTAAEAMSALNRDLLESNLGFRFITLCMAVMEPGSQELTLVNAGHLPPLMHDANGSRYLEGDYSGLPLGIGGDSEYSEHRIAMTSDSHMLFYTDGITETSDSMDVLYGRDHLLKAVPEAPFSAKSLIETVLEDTDRFSAGDSQQDDRCMVAIHCLPLSAR